VNVGQRHGFFDYLPIRTLPNDGRSPLVQIDDGLYHLGRAVPRDRLCPPSTGFRRRRNLDLGNVRLATRCEEREQHHNRGWDRNPNSRPRVAHGETSSRRRTTSITGPPPVMLHFVTPGSAPPVHAIVRYAGPSTAPERSRRRWASSRIGYTIIRQAQRLNQENPASDVCQWPGPVVAKDLRKKRR
jgi:hypothetical protein